MFILTPVTSSVPGTVVRGPAEAAFLCSSLWAKGGSMWSAPSASEWVFGTYLNKLEDSEGVKWQELIFRERIRGSIGAESKGSGCHFGFVMLLSSPLHCLLALHIWLTYSIPKSLRCPLRLPLPHWLVRLLTAHSSSSVYSLLTPALMHHLPNSWTHPPHILSYSSASLPPFVHPCGPTATPTFTKLSTQPLLLLLQKATDQVLCGSCGFCCERQMNQIW